MNFFKSIKILFPRARAFDLFIDTNKRKLIQGLSDLPEDIRHEAELVYADLFPDTTRVPEDWEQTFSIYLNEAEYPKRRGLMEALWKTISGDQGVNFLQSVLRAIDPEFTVAENVPLTDPRNKQSAGLAICDYPTMVCDGEFACCDYLRGDDTFTPSILQNDTSSIYTIPDDPQFWETCFFVCNTVYRSPDNTILYIKPLEVPVSWKNIIEFLILRIKPVQTTAVLFIKWIDDTAGDITIED